MRASLAWPWASDGSIVPEPAFRASIAAAKAEGRLHDAVKDAAGLLWALVHLQQRYADARALFDGAIAARNAVPGGRCLGWTITPVCWHRTRPIRTLRSRSIARPSGARAASD